jgi:hypothetical protein
MSSGCIVVTKLPPASEGGKSEFASSPFINTGYIYHLNMLITPAFVEHPAILEKIQEMYFGFDQLSFDELTPEDFSTAVRCIYRHIHQLQNPTEGQQLAIGIWDKFVEPLVIADPRFKGWA